MWRPKEPTTVFNSVQRSLQSIKSYSEFFSMSKNNLLELFDDGYQDAKNNKSYLDTMFTPKYDDEIDGIEI
jgi:hypothetical protein